ncbi:MAG: DNA-3-methyladenine glycosylase family protein [Bacteroidota bacterium]
MSNPIFYIRLPEFFSFRHCLWYLDRNLDDCTHEVSGDKVRKLVKLQGEKILLEISSESGSLKIEALSGKVTHPKDVISYVSNWFDLDRDLAPFYGQINRDPDLHPLLQLQGLRLIGIPDFFEAIAWGIIGQQINLAFAYKMKRRFTERYGESLLYDKKAYYLFPDPEIVQHIPIEDLKAFQFSGRKAEYLIGAAALFAAGELSKEQISALKSEDLMLQKLISIRGIGEWTAHYALLKGIKTMNNIPYGDTGLDTALYKLKGIERKQNRKVVDAFFEQFRGWKSYLVFYLWQSLRS